MFFNVLLADAQANLASAKEARNGPGISREGLLIAAALQLDEYFETSAKLQSFQMTLLLKSEDTLEGTERVFKYRQHLKIVAPGCEQLQTADDKAAFFLTTTPFWLMGDGSFTLERDDALLQAVRACEPGSDAKLSAAFALAVRLDRAFQRVRFDHYLGETH